MFEQLKIDIKYHGVWWSFKYRIFCKETWKDLLTGKGI